MPHSRSSPSPSSEPQSTSELSTELPSTQASKPTLRQLLKSVFGALFGVQSDQHRQADFSQSRVWPYIVVGIAAIVLFVAILIVISQWVSR